jgi:hypothetical protein
LLSGVSLELDEKLELFWLTGTGSELAGTSLSPYLIESIKDVPRVNAAFNGLTLGFLALSGLLSRFSSLSLILLFRLGA